MRHRAILFPLACAILAAGCAEPAPAGQAEPSRETRLIHDTSGCIESLLLVLRDFDDLAPYLPDGYVAADAQPLIGTPMPMGQGAVFLTAIECTHASLAEGAATFAEGGILIETPQVTGFEGVGVGYDFFTPQMLVTQSTMLAPVADIGAPAIAADIVIDVREESGRVLSEAEIVADDGTSYAYTSEGFARDTFTGVVRLWSQTLTGTSLVTLDIVEQAIAQGPVTTCTFSAGSVYADIMGLTSCRPGDAVAMVWLTQGWSGTVRHVPTSQ